MKRSIRIYSVVSNSFRFGFLVMARTVLRHNPEHDIQFVVVHHPQLSALDEEHRRWLESEVPNLEFRVPDLGPYEKIFWLRDKVFKTPRQLWAAFFILEAFADPFEGEVLSLDSDMICLQSFSEELFAGEDFKAVEALDGQRRPLGFFNTGVISLGRAVRGPRAFERLMREADPLRYMERAGKADQALLSLFFTPRNARSLPWRYNMTRRHVPARGVEPFLKEQGAVFFHFVGEKPWHVSLDPRDLQAGEAEALWDRVVCEILSPTAYVKYLESWRDISRAHGRAHIQRLESLPLWRRIIGRRGIAGKVKTFSRKVRRALGAPT
jgi:hypothetical protein